MRSLALLCLFTISLAHDSTAEQTEAISTKQYEYPRHYLFNQSGTLTISKGTSYRLRVLMVGGGGYGCQGNGDKRGVAGQVEIVIIDATDPNKNITFDVKVGKGGKFPRIHGIIKNDEKKESSFHVYKADGGTDCGTDDSGWTSSLTCLDHFKHSHIRRDTVVRDINITACGSATRILKSGEGGITINGFGPSAMPGKYKLSSPGGFGYGAGGGSGGNHQESSGECNTIDGGDGAPGVVYIEVVPQVCRKPVSVIFSIEYATSNSFKSQKNVIHNLSNLIPQRNVGVISYKDNAFLKVKLGEYDNEKLMSAINNISNADSTEMVNFANVYQTALTAFQDKEVSRINANPKVNFTKTLVMFIHSWKYNASGNKLPSWKKKLKAFGVKIVLIGLDEMFSDNQLQEIVNEDDHVYTLKGDDYEHALPQKEPYVLDTICREPSYLPATPTKSTTSKRVPFKGKTADELQKDFDLLINYNMEKINIQNTTEIQRVMKIADDLIQNSHRIPNTTKIAPGLKVIQFMEDFGLKMASTMAPLENEGSSTRQFSTKNLGMNLFAVDLTSTKSIDLPDTMSKSHVIIPKDAFQGNGRGTVVVLTSSPVASMNKKNNSKINTKLLSINIDPKSPNVFTKPVELVFDVNEAALQGEQLSCEFWDNKKREEFSHGSWSMEGCKVESANKTTVTCHVSHLTSFAVLTRVGQEAKPFKQHEKYLTIITFVGCSLSMLGCILTIIIHAVLPSLRTERAFIHMNLVIAIFLGQGFFLVSALLDGPTITCFVSGVALYFFYLSVFTWMLVEGLHIYCLVIRVFHSGHERKRLYMAIGWLLPFIITVICASAFRGNFISTEVCWLSVQSGAIWAFVGPVVVIIAVNLVILILVLRVTAGVMVKDEIQNRSNRSLVRACITLLPILGLTWMFGTLAFSNNTVVFEYLFCIFNSLQGLFIFLFYCAGSSEVRRECRRKLHTYETKRSLRSSQNTTSYHKSGKQSSSSKVSRNSNIMVKDKDTTTCENTLL